MARIKKSLLTVLILAVGMCLMIPGALYAKKLYIGGTMALTGAFAEDTAAILAAYEDYARYVNKTKKLAPWRDEKFPSDVELDVLWRDDELKPPKALTIYDELKDDGILVFRCSSSGAALALKDTLWEDKMGAVSMATGPYLMKPPESIFSYYPIYTDTLAAIAQWFKESWKKNRKPRVAYLNADHPMGRSIDIPEMREALEKMGYEFVGSQYVPLVPSTPPTTQLLWLKKNKVDLALGVMINPGSQPTVKEMTRLGMGPNLDYKITFGCAAPSHMAVFTPAMGHLGDGFVVGGSFPPFTETKTPGIRFAKEIQAHRSEPVTHIMYIGGLLEAMIQVEALRLTMQQMPFDKMTPKDVLEKGFYKIKNLKTGDLSAVPISYGPGQIEGVNMVRIDQQIDGKIVKQGVYPTMHIY